MNYRRNHKQNQLLTILYGIGLSLTIITSAFSQTRYEVSGWNDIKFISIHYIPTNPILSGNEAVRIVKAIGYKTLPDGIKLGESTIEKLTGDSIPIIELRISLIASTTNGERYFGIMRISLESPVPIPFLRKRIITDAPDEGLGEWKPYTENATLINTDDLIILQEKNSIIDMFRERVGEVFEELTIKIRENP